MHIITTISTSFYAIYTAPTTDLMYLTTTIPTQYPQGQVSLNLLVYVSVGIAAVFAYDHPRTNHTLLDSALGSLLFFYDQIKKFMTFCNNQMVLCYS